MKEFYTKENDTALANIRRAVAEDGEARVVNIYESAYGCEFDGWLRNGLAGINCTIQAHHGVSWLPFPSDYTITLNR